MPETFSWRKEKNACGGFFLAALFRHENSTGNREPYRIGAAYGRAWGEGRRDSQGRFCWAPAGLLVSHMRGIGRAPSPPRGVQLQAGRSVTGLQKGRPRAAARIAARRARLLALIRRNAATGMLAPTIRDHIAREGLRSHGAASKDFANLEAEGHIRRLPSRARAVEPFAPISRPVLSDRAPRRGGYPCPAHCRSRQRWRGLLPVKLPRRGYGFGGAFSGGKRRGRAISPR